MPTKDQELLGYLIKNHPKASVTVLMKLAYLIDLISMKKNKQKISSYNYMRYNYGPFDNSIYNDIKALVDLKVVLTKPEYTSTGDEFIIYCFNADSDITFKQLEKNERSIIDTVIEQVKGYGAKTLTDIAYKTKPMLKLGAKRGGKEHFGEFLNLKAN